MMRNLTKEEVNDSREDSVRRRRRRRGEEHVEEDKTRGKMAQEKRRRKSWHSVDMPKTTATSSCKRKTFVNG